MLPLKYNENTNVIKKSNDSSKISGLTNLTTKVPTSNQKTPTRDINIIYEKTQIIKKEASPLTIRQRKDLTSIRYKKDINMMEVQNIDKIKDYDRNLLRATSPNKKEFDRNLLRSTSPTKKSSPVKKITLDKILSHGSRSKIVHKDLQPDMNNIIINTPSQTSRINSRKNSPRSQSHGTQTTETAIIMGFKESSNYKRIHEEEIHKTDQAENSPKPQNEKEYATYRKTSIENNMMNKNKPNLDIVDEKKENDVSKSKIDDNKLPTIRTPENVDESKDELDYSRQAVSKCVDCGDDDIYIQTSDSPGIAIVENLREDQISL